MRVLWFTNSVSLYVPTGSFKRHGYNGGGWITSAQKLILGNSDIILGVCFQMKGQPRKCVQDGVVYYPIEPIGGMRLRFNDIWHGVLGSHSYQSEERSWEYFYAEFRRVIDDFHPDIIHVFGSERESGLVAKITDVPVLVHIQGIISPILNAFLPPFMSWRDYLLSESSTKTMALKLSSRRAWGRDAYREREILRSVKYYMGRTEWCKRVINVFNPKAKYFHCNEALRDVFYKANPRNLPKRLTIVTTISSPPYKGADLVLKTAKLLKENLIQKFDWFVYGVTNCKYMEKFSGIRHEDVNIHMMGIASAEELMQAELKATVYVHSSYIENSPNSLCEAQLLGVACIATNVGGTSSLIEDGKTGFLVPANDPYQLAYLIHHLYINPQLNMQIGCAAHQMALHRHDRKEIAQRIVSVYNQILDENKNNCQYE